MSTTPYCPLYTSPLLPDAGEISQQSSPNTRGNIVRAGYEDSQEDKGGIFREVTSSYN